MNNYTTLYIDLSKSPRNALVISGSTNSNTQAIEYVLNDNVNINVVLMNNGDIDSLSGNSNYGLSASLGLIGSIYASGSIGYPNTLPSSFTGSLNISSSLLNSAIGSLDKVEPLIQFQLINKSNSLDRKTILQQKTTIWNKI